MKDDAFLEKISRMTNKVNPDFTVITGDLVDGSAPLHKGMLSPINKIKSPVFYSTGNHEMYEGIDKVLKIVKETKIKYLGNKKIIFKGLQIIGIDYSDEKDYSDKLFSTILKNLKIEKNKPSILLYHLPLKLEKLDKAGINLHLAGHTHNGQIFPFNLFAKLQFKYIYGLHKFGNANQYISSGTGLWGPPMRILSKSEIVLIKLVPEK
jgi:uncharacterized protein